MILDAEKLVIRPGTTKDASAVHTLLAPFVEQSLLLERSKDEVAHLTCHSVAAEYEGELIGFAAVEVYSRKMAEVQCLAVREGFQQLGVGRKLVARCVELAKELNVVELMAISSSDEFLQQCGFDYSLPGQKRALFINP